MTDANLFAFRHSAEFISDAVVTEVSFAYEVRTYDSPYLVSGDEGIRTPDPLLARQVLSQLSYTPI